MPNFIKFKYFHRDTKLASLPAMYRNEISFPKYENYINPDTIELVTTVKPKTISIKVPYTSELKYEDIELFMIKTISDNYYYCPKTEFYKFIQEIETEKNITI